MSGSNSRSPGNNARVKVGRMSSRIGSPSRWVFLLLLCHFSSWHPIVARADTPSAPPAILVGWEQTYQAGRWTQVVLDVNVPAAGDYQVEVTAPDPDGHRVAFSSSSQVAVPGRQQLRGFFKAGRLNPEIEARVVAASSGDVIQHWNASEFAALQASLLSPTVRLIVTVGKPAGFDWEQKTAVEEGAQPSGSSKVAGSGFRIVATSLGKLPVNAIGYDGVSLLVLAGPAVMSRDQSTALRDWVVGGGRVVISLPADVKAAKSIVEPLADWLPVSIGSDEVMVRNFGKLELFAGRNVRIPFTGRMSIPSVRIEQGEYLAGGRDEALLARTPYGMGCVTVLALDLTEPPLTRWTEISSLARRLADSSAETDSVGARQTKSSQLSSNGVSDLSTQLHGVQEDFADVTRASPWFVMGLLGVLMLVIGPLDYLVVHRLFGRPRVTWITFPALIVVATVLSANLAHFWNGSARRINQLNLVNVDVATATCHQKLWTNVYSPVTGRNSVLVRSSISGVPSSVHSSWAGVAETSFGGMLRPSGLVLGRADYRQSLDGPIQGLPLFQWSSKPLFTEIHSPVDHLVDADLQTTGAGRLTGTLTHRFPSPIEDWFIIHGNRVYRQMKQREDSKTLPLAPRQVWRVEQPNVFQREVRAFLTGETATSKQREGSKFSDVIQRHAVYDPLSRDPVEILRTLTFYHDAGGSEYTTLTNNILDSEDLSHLLKLGRAVLFGRLNSPTAVIQVDGQATEPDRELTFLRLVLPVKKSTTEFPPALERLSQ